MTNQVYAGPYSSLTVNGVCIYLLDIEANQKYNSHYYMRLRMVLISIELLKAYGTIGLMPAGRLSAWATAGADSAYSLLVVNIIFFHLKYKYTLLDP